MMAVGVGIHHQLQHQVAHGKTTPQGALRGLVQAGLIEQHWASRWTYYRLRLLGFFCSTKCPGDAILQTYDLVRALRDAGVAVIGGFHSPMEKECLDLLLRGNQPIVICPARSIERMRFPAAWRKPLVEDRLLVLSPFGAKHQRATTDLAESRNRFIAALADEIFVAYAATGSKTERFCRELLNEGNES